MRLFLKFCLLLLCIVPAPAFAAGGFPASLTETGQHLVLNGQGTRTKLLFHLYDAALYLPEKNRNAAAIIAAEKPMAVRLIITSSLITSKRMEEAVREGFADAHAGPKLQSRIDQMISVFETPIKTGDVYDFVYRPGTLTIVKNGKPATTIPGADFKQALFSIWLGATPVQASLKTGMLGG